MSPRTLRLRVLELPVPDSAERARILDHTMRNGAAWETSSTQLLNTFLHVVKSKNHYRAKRLGTKAVKKQEILDNVGNLLGEEQ